MKTLSLSLSAKWPVHLLAVICMLITTANYAQQIIPLYADKIPNSIPAKNEEYANEGYFVFKVSAPTLTIFLPPADIANGTAVVLYPGGGYGGVNMVDEGSKIAAKLNKLGVAAFVVKYRLPDDRIMPDKKIGPLQDAQQAIKEVRRRAKEWHVDTAKVGVMGFSAGGHLASTTGVFYNRSYIDNPGKINLRPDFMILVYPVISFTDSIAHMGSRENLVGKNAPAALVNEWSTEMQVTPKTPPTFLIMAGDDGLVPVANSVAFYEALQKNKVPAGLHIFAVGEHGFPTEPAHSTWFDYCVNWLKENRWIK